MMDLGSAQAAYDDPQTGLSEQTHNDLWLLKSARYVAVGRVGWWSGDSGLVIIFAG